MPRRTIHEVSVEGAQRRKPSNHVVYSIKVAWSDGTINIIYRRYSEVLQLERNLLEIFPSNKRRRFIPSLQGRIKLVPTSVHAKVDRIRDFLLNLISLPDHISKCQLVTSFFTPRPEDLESVEPKNPGRKKSKAKLAGNILRKISLGHSKPASCIGEPVLLEQYVVLKNYQKQYGNDISLTKGYTVDVIEKHESGWWHVDCEGDIGWVPASFIEPVCGDNNNEDGDSIVTEIFPAGKEEIYMTTHSYQAKKEDEISFDIGVNLQVIEKTLDGWWRVIYMNKEGWAPAVYLKRVSVATGNSPTSLRRLSAMGMHLRDETRDFEEMLNTEGQDGGASLLTPVWNLNRRHSASEAEVSLVKTENHESPLSSRRSTWGSMGDLRDALPNRGLSISELDLRLAHRKEKERLAADALKRNRSFSFSNNMKDVFGKKNAVASVSSEDVQTSVEVSSSPLLRLRAFSKSLEFLGSTSSKLKLSLSENSLNQRELRASLPSICITPSASDTKSSPCLSRKLGSTPGNVEARGGNECLNINVNHLGIKKEEKEKTEKKGAEDKEVLTPIWNTYRRHSTSEVEVSLLKTETQNNPLISRRSSWSTHSMRSTRDLRDALPNRGLSISELDLRLAHRKEEEGLAMDTLKRNCSFSFSDNIKEVFRKKNPTEVVSSEKVQTPMKVSSSALPRLKACSKSLDSSSSIASKLTPNISENSLNPRKLRVSLPSICITPPASDTEQSPRLSKKLGSTPEIAEALGGNECLASNVNQLGHIIQAKEETKEKENKQLRGVEENENACGKTNGTNKHQKQEEHKQKQQQGENNEFDCKGDTVQEGHHETERDIKTERRLIDKVETEKEGLEEELFAGEQQENSDSTISSETDADIYFAVSTYVASGDGEMSVFEEDEVKVASKAPNGWWMVHVDGEAGWVPSNFLVAGGGQEEEDDQESLESDADEENDGLSFVEDDGDDDEHEHEDDNDDDDYDDDDDDDDDFDILFGVYDPKTEGQSVAWTQPVLRPGSHPDRYHKKKYKYSGMGSVSSCHAPGLSKEYSCDLGVKSRDVTKRSRGTSSKSSTETNSSNSDKPPRSEISRRKDSEKKAFNNNKQAYKIGRGHNTRHCYKAMSCCKEGVCRQQKWYKRCEAMNSTRRSSQARYPVPTEEHRSPLVKQKNVVSYDSGFLEDERTNAGQWMRHSSSLPDTRGNHHKRLSHVTSYRGYHSRFNQGYTVRKYRVDRAPLNVFHADYSSDDEVFFKTKNCFVDEDSSCDDLTPHSYTLRPRKKRNRPKVPKYSIQEDARYGRYESEGRHSKKLTYQAIASYQASTDGTIDLYEGDKVHVIRKTKGGWWFVQIDDEVGWAPSNYLEPTTCYDE